MVQKGVFVLKTDVKIKKMEALKRTKIGVFNVYFC